MKSMLQKKLNPNIYFPALLTDAGEQYAPGRGEKNRGEKKEIREIVGGNMKQMQLVRWKNRCDVRI